MHFNGWSERSSPGERLIGNNIRARVIHSRLADVVWPVGRVPIGLPVSLSEKRPTSGEEASLRRRHRRRCIIASLILLDKYNGLVAARILNRPQRTRQLYNSSKTV